LSAGSPCGGAAGGSDLRFFSVRVPVMAAAGDEW
jgi:hypothetical protein